MNPQIFDGILLYSTQNFHKYLYNEEYKIYVSRIRFNLDGIFLNTCLYFLKYNFMLCKFKKKRINDRNVVPVKNTIL